MSDDQAQHLRRLICQAHVTQGRVDDERGASGLPLQARTLAITGGKGGVGKTNVAVALALCAARRGLRVGLMDADFGLAKIHILLGLSPKADLRDVLAGNARFADTLIPGPEGLWVLPGASGLVELANLDGAQRALLLAGLQEVAGMFDLLLVDTGAGIGEGVLTFVTAADEAVVVTTPEPTALADAYALIKVLRARRDDLPMHLVVNNAVSLQEAEAVARRLQDVAGRFLQVPLAFAGSIPADQAVGAAVRARKPFLSHTPRSPASLSFGAIADALLPKKPSPPGSFHADPLVPNRAAPKTAPVSTFVRRLAVLFGRGDSPP